jgi:predicted nucleic acid-binding protein
MARYTLDAIGLLFYLFDILPDQADRAFTAAEAGTAVIEAPRTVFLETIYTIANRDEIRALPVTITPRDALEAIEGESPVQMANSGYADLYAVTDTVETLSIHDAMIVANHRTHETDAVITNDPKIAATATTIWE